MGVLLDANSLMQTIGEKAPQARVKAILDSSWQLDLPYAHLCSSSSSKSSNETIFADTNETCIINKIFNRSLE